MKFIRAKLHGILDYGIIFILFIPWITNFYKENEDTWILAAAGTFLWLISLFTDYDFGLIKLIPMKIHLLLDFLVAIFLIALPFIFPLFDYYFFWPMLIGLGGLLITLLSSSKPYVVTEKDLNITKPY